MALQSELFRGDPKLEAAAVSDPAHIVPGAAGDHVRKIQMALIRLDGATVAADGLYGPETAAAVLAYKQKRKIVNRSYQTTADNIVGKMTIAELDKELSDLDRPKGPIQLRVISPKPDRLNHRPQVVAGAPRGSGSAFSLAPALYAAPGFSQGPVVSINRGQSALVEVTNGSGGTIASGDPKIAFTRDPNSKTLVTKITSDPQTVEIVGNHRGGAVIIVNTASAPPLSLPQSMFMASITVSVKETRPTVYTPTMTPHDHRPTKQWSKLLSAIDQPTDTFAGKALYALCAVGADPQTFVNAAIARDFNGKPVALKHLNWYLRDGRGQELNEDDNIASWVRADSAIRQKVTALIIANASKGLQYGGYFAFTQSDFIDQDFRYAFGTIDRLDWAVDWVVKAAKLWFKDSYEWHPVCPGFYTKFSDDVVRETNSLHAALVEMKDRGAADYWMVGEATLPLSVFGFPP